MLSSTKHHQRLPWAWNKTWCIKGVSSHHLLDTPLVVIIRHIQQLDSFLKSAAYWKGSVLRNGKSLVCETTLHVVTFQSSRVMCTHVWGFNYCHFLQVAISPPHTHTHTSTKPSNEIFCPFHFFNFLCQTWTSYFLLGGRIVQFGTGNLKNGMDKKNFLLSRCRRIFWLVMR